MICFNCGYKLNKEGATHCKVCGVKFDQLCNSCGKENPVLARFCLHCGEELVSKSKVIKNLEETRKNVAVMFADISGFTKLSEQLDSEVARKIINDTFQYVTTPVYELKGSVDKYIGDCVMILFGAETSHSDDVDRALKCAMEMMKRINEYSLEVLSKYDVKINLTIGLNYGSVVTGQVGNLYTKDYTVIGDVVNTAQRLQGKSKPGEILVSKSIFEETREYIHYSENRKLILKNKEFPVDAYKVISINRSIALDKDIVKREKELSNLESTFENKTTTVNVLGEVGVGKTTLVREYLKGLSSKVRVIWAESNSIYKDRPFSGLSVIISTILNIRFNDSVRVKTNRLRSFLDYILIDVSEEDVIRNYNFLALVLGLSKDEEHEAIINSMSYDDLRDELLKQVSLFFTFLSKRQEVLIVLDDADSSDIESVETLVNLKECDQKIIMISETKIEGTEKLIKLVPFSFEQTKELVLAGSEKILDDDSVKEIHELSKGIPQFINEIMKKIKRENLLIERDELLYLDKTAIEKLPKSLETLVLNRVESIDKNGLELLRIASVIGSEFNLALIRNVVDFDESVLTDLTSKELIEFRFSTKISDESDERYAFKQKVIQTTIYDNMLNSRKKEIHSELARALDKSTTKMNEIIGYHYEKAGIYRLAKKYYYKYAVQNHVDFRYETALVYFEKVIKLEKGKVQTLSVEAHLRKVRIYLSMSNFDFAETEITKMEPTVVKIEDRLEYGLLKAKLYMEQSKFEECLSLISSLENEIGKTNNLFGRLLQIKCVVYLMTGRLDVIDIVKESEEILTRTRDYSALAETMSYAGIASFMKGKLEDAIYYLNKGYDYAKLTNNLLVASKISTNLGVVYHASGEVAKSFTYLETAIEASLKISNAKNYLSAAINLGVFYMEKGLFSKAKPLFEESIDKAIKSKMSYQQCIANINLADLELELGIYDKSITHYNEAKEISEEFDLKSEIGVSNLGIAKVLIETNNLNEAKQYLEKARLLFDQTEEQSNVAEYYYQLAIFNHANDLSWDADLEKSLKSAKESHNETMELRGLLFKASVENDLILIENAKEIASRIESDYELAKIYLVEYNISKNVESLNKFKALVKKFDKCKLSDEMIN